MKKLATLWNKTLCTPVAAVIRAVVRYLLMFQDIFISADGAGGDHQGGDQGGGAGGGRGGAPPQEQPAQAAVPPVPAAGAPHSGGAGARPPLRHQQQPGECYLPRCREAEIETQMILKLMLQSLSNRLIFQL